MTVTAESNYTNLTPSYCLFPRRELDFVHFKKVSLLVICHHKTVFLCGENQMGLEYREHKGSNMKLKKKKMFYCSTIKQYIKLNIKVPKTK